MTRWWIIVVLTGIIAASASPAAAQRVMHRVRFGQTLRSIADYYYGDTSVTPLLGTVNGRSPNDRLSAGERLRVPTAWLFSVPRRMSLGLLAKQLLGDARRAFALRTFNQVKGRRVRAGTQLLVPFVIDHPVQQGETYVDLAKRYYGDPTRAELIARYNFLRHTDPPPRTVLAIPIARMQIRSVRLAQLTRQQVLGISSSNRGSREALQEANALLREGKYWHVPLRLIRMLSDERASDNDVAEAYKLLAVAYVAVDRHDLAVKAFAEALLRKPTMRTDPVIDSPKVIKAFVDAKSRVGAKH